jgi:hypothetical protein
MFQYLPDFLINLIAGIVGIVFVLWLERQKRPGLSMKVGIPSTIDEQDVLKRKPTTFLRVNVHNKTVPKWLAWVYDGEPALSCTGWISFHHLDGQRVFSQEMLARWSETLDPPPIQITKTDEGNVARLVNPQDSVDIPPGESTLLDVCCRFIDEEVCYGWNNESYLHNWRNPSRKLDKGRYLARVRVKSGGREFQDVFMIIDDVPFGDFRLEPALPKYKEAVKKAS